jgi:hypothetical protein
VASSTTLSSGKQVPQKYAFAPQDRQNITQSMATIHMDLIQA